MSNAPLSPPKVTSPAGHLSPLPGGHYSVWAWVCLRSAGFPALACTDAAAPSAARAADRLLDKSEDAAAEADYETTLAVEDRAVRTRLQERFAEWDVQLALRWQNPGALDGTIGWFLRQSPDVWNRRMREAERLVGRFLQRYALKNDSIGHFGPLAWGVLDPRPGSTSLVPGNSLIAERFVRLEGWCVDALLEAAEPDPDAEPSFRPRRLPFWYLDGTRAVFPARTELAARFGVGAEAATVPIDDDLLPVIELCDGQRCALEIARDLAGEPVSAADAAPVLALLRRLRSKGLIAFAPEVPPTLHPERSLRQFVTEIEDPAARARLDARVAPVLAAYDDVVAADSPDGLGVALSRLESSFASVAARAPRRAAGRTYAARTLIHMDAVRDVDLRLGPEFLDALGPPLSLVLASARWFTYTLAERLRPALADVHDRLSRGTEAGTVAFQRFATDALPIIVDDCLGIHRSVVADLQGKWASIFGHGAAERRQQFHAADLAPAVEEAFAAPHPGWQLARYVSPDVLVAAKDAAAVARGELTLVLGELHLYNTVSRGFFLEAHPDPKALFQARSADIPGACVLPVPSKRFSVPRIAVGLDSPRDVWFAYEDAPTGTAPDRTVNLGELVVVKEVGGLLVRTRDRRFSCPAIEFVAHAVANAAMSFPSLLPPTPHAPRVTIDRLVVQRETWRLTTSELEPPRLHDQAAPSRGERFLAGRRLQRRLGMPRRLFVRAAGEKPICVDFESPVLVDVFGHLAGGRPDDILYASELVPDLDELWLVDATGHHYTSELRLVVLDPASPVQDIR